MQSSPASRDLLEPGPAMQPTGSSPSLAGRAFLALALLVGFYALALAIAGGLLFIVYAEWQLTHRVNARIALFCIIGAVVVLWSIVPRPDRFTVPGARLDPESQPELFDTVGSVATSTGQEMPAEVYLIPDVNAFVTQRGGVMGFGSRRVMAIGLGLMQVVTVSQLKAIIAHEFGHYYGGDTRLGPWIYKTRVAIGRTLHNLGRHGHTSWMQRPFLWYGNMFLRVTHAISRRQEFVADELAARTVGARALITGLQALHGGAWAFEAYMGTEVAPVVNAGFRPPLAGGFAHFLAASHVADLMSRSVEAELGEGKTDPYDTHPSLPERVAALERLPAGPDPAEDPPAISLLPGLPDLETRLFLTLGNEVEMRALKPIAWEAAGEQAYLPRYEALVREQARALRGVTPLSLPELAKDLGRLAGRFVRPGGGELTIEDLSEAPRLAAMTLGAGLAVALYRAGWELHTPPGETVSCRRDAFVIEPFNVVQDLASGKLDAEAWQQRCEEAGIGNLDLGSAS